MPLPDNAKLPEAKAQRTKGVSRARLSPQMKEVIEEMAYKGTNIAEAAKQAGIQERSARLAFRKTHVKQAYNKLVQEIRDNAAQAAYLRINHMGEKAASEHVKLDANKWVAGVDGISPVQKVQGQHHHTVQFAGFGYDDEPVDITPDTDSASVDDDDESPAK